MKIAQIAPLIESVPPRLYGGTERVVSYLTEELVGTGHDVTLFASGDSITTANLVPCVPEALRLDPRVKDPVPYYMLMLDRVRQLSENFDVLHFHIDQFQFPVFRAIAAPNRHHIARPSGINPIFFHFTWASMTCPWFRSPMISVGQCRERIS